MAIGLQIRNPDLSQKLTPRYSDFMRGWAKKDPAFCQYVHDKLSELVKLAKEVILFLCASCVNFCAYIVANYFVSFLTSVQTEKS